MVDDVVSEALVKQQWMSHSPTDGESELIAGEMTEKEKALAEQWLRMAPPKKKLRKLKVREGQLILFEM